MLTATAMCTRIRAADGKDTTTAIGITYRTPDRRSLSTPNSRSDSGVISAPLPPLGVREAGVVASASIVVREAVGASTVVVDSAGSVVVGTVEASVVSVAEEVGGAVALADLVAGSADFAAGGSGGRSTDKLEIRKAKSETISNDQKGERPNKEWILTGRNGDNRGELNSVFSIAFCEDATINQQEEEVTMITLTSK